jgi:alpha-L-fucosidase
MPGHADGSTLNHGLRDGADWLPGEVDVSIRPGWFYHASQDGRVRSPQNLLKIYYESVGRGANLILNLPPDRRGRLHENDVKSLHEWGRLLDATFAKDLARGAKASASNTRGNDEQFAAGNVCDGKLDTFWATDDAVTTPELVLDLGRPVKFNVARVREYLPLGQRIDAIAVDTWDGSGWKPFAAATSVGSQRLLRGKNVTTNKVRVRVTKAAACPAISEFGLFLSPAE